MSRVAWLSAALFSASVLAQTFTTCDPLNTTCPDDPALGTTLSQNFTDKMTEFDPAYWNVTSGASLISFGQQGAELALHKKGDTVTVQSNFYIFWGTAEIVFQAAAGQGIVTSAILLSDDLDEIDWEIIGGNSTHVENNWYGQGNQSQINSEWPLLNGAQSDFHKYTIHWTPESIQWSLDDNVVRSVGFAAPGLYPQTPCRFSFGLWCAGCSDQPGTVAWAGGKADWGQAPFVMSVKSITVTDGTLNSSFYSYGDTSGTYQSIKVAEGESEAYKAINSLSTSENAKKKWAGLSTGAKIAIACSVLGVFAICAIVFAFYCLKQRKAGRAEAALHEKEWQAQNSELMEYRSMMAEGNFAVSRQSILMDAKKPMSPRPMSARPMGARRF